MRLIIAAAMIMVSATSAFALSTYVPEIDASAGITAMGAVGAIFALVLERRRRKQ